MGRVKQASQDQAAQPAWPGLCGRCRHGRRSLPFENTWSWGVAAVFHEARRFQDGAAASGKIGKPGEGTAPVTYCGICEIPSGPGRTEGAAM